MTPDEIKVRKLSKEEAIRRLKEIYDIDYDPAFPADVWDQLLMCEAVEEAQQEEKKRIHSPKIDNKREDAGVIGNVIDTHKPSVNFELTESKLRIIKELQTCTYQTPPIEVAELLDEFFADPETKPNHWLNIAQMYPPRRIHLTINQMIKRQSGGWITIQSPAAYFTSLIKFRKKRKLTGINDNS